MLDPITQKKILLLKAHAKQLFSLADELLGEGSKQNAKVKKLDDTHLAEIEAKQRAKIIS